MSDEEEKTQKIQESSEGESEKKTDKKQELVEKEEELSKREELLEREKELLEKEKLGGQSEAGHIPPKPEPETDEEYTERFERGEIDLSKP